MRRYAGRAILGESIKRFPSGKWSSGVHKDLSIEKVYMANLVAPTEMKYKVHSS
jgi:hypothetical protein